MLIHCSDSQTVGETDEVLFTLIQQSPMAAQFFLTNSGVNTINYRFQQLLGDGTWEDLADISPANDLNSTLVASQTKSVVVTGNYSQCRLRGNASGGAQLEFGLTRFVTRLSRGSLPILNF
jgi:hypothetical protein